ncbi:MAG: hypothetical protein V4485_06480, partial [Pseudomonadota bacterium]
MAKAFGITFDKIELAGYRDYGRVSNLITSRNLYTYDQVRQLLTQKFSPGGHLFATISPATVVERSVVFEANIAPAIMKLISSSANVIDSSGRSLIIPIHTTDNHWTGMVIKRDPGCRIQVIYNDPTGKPLDYIIDVVTLIKRLTSMCEQDVSFIDIAYRQQLNENDGGPFTVENLWALGCAANTANLSRKDLWKLLPDSSEAQSTRKVHASIMHPSEGFIQVPDDASDFDDKDDCGSSASAAASSSAPEKKEYDAPKFHTMRGGDMIDETVQKILVRTKEIKPLQSHKPLVDEKLQLKHKKFYEAKLDLDKEKVDLDRLKAAHEIIFDGKDMDIVLMNDALGLVREIINKSEQKLASGKDSLRQDKVYIFCAGHTQVGKSTFISYMRHDNLMVKRHKSGHILDNSGVDDPIFIGHTNASATVDVRAIDIPGLGVFIDWPGSMDTGGHFTRLKNFLIQQHILNTVSEGKLMFLIPHSKINGGAKGQEFAEEMTKICGGALQVRAGMKDAELPNIAIVVTKY